jgi:hypothetical protein
MEAKHTQPTPVDLQTVEYQGFITSFAYCEHFQQDQVAIMTCAGGLSRLWIYERDADYLMPWIPAIGSGLGVIDEYIDLGGEQEREIIKGLKYIRDNRIPPVRLLPSACSLQPTHMTLPDN